jgi:hypothetical protein
MKGKEFAVVNLANEIEKKTRNEMKTNEELA